METSKTEAVSRIARRNLYIVLFMVLVLGGTLLSGVLWPESAFSQWPSRAPWLIPMGIIFLAGATGVGVRWRPDSPDVQAVLTDEWRQQNLSRAIRIAFVLVLAAQVPQALLFSDLPPLRAAMGMAVMTITVALATLITLFLLFDRDTAHE
jgi:hypothetical protein